MCEGVKKIKLKRKYFVAYSSLRDYYIIYTASLCNMYIPKITIDKTQGNITINQDIDLCPALQIESKTNVQNTIYEKLNKNNNVVFPTLHLKFPAHRTSVFPLFCIISKIMVTVDINRYTYEGVHKLLINPLLLYFGIIYIININY